LNIAVFFSCCVSWWISFDLRVKWIHPVWPWEIHRTIFQNNGWLGKFTGYVEVIHPKWGPQCGVHSNPGGVHFLCNMCMIMRWSGVHTVHIVHLEPAPGEFQVDFKTHYNSFVCLYPKKKACFFHWFPGRQRENISSLSPWWGYVFNWFTMNTKNQTVFNFCMQTDNMFSKSVFFGNGDHLQQW